MAVKPQVPWSRRAYVTFLMFSDSYLPGCLMTAYGLRRQRTRARLVCMVTADVTAGAREALRALYDDVVPVDELNPPRDEQGSRQFVPRVFTRFNALRLGPDGGLARDYRKVVLLDADLLPLRDYDDLWELPAPAGLINERRDHVVELDADGCIVQPEGPSVWHRVYGSVCPHGAPIPREITDRVGTDHTNRGINGSLFVFEPSAAEYEAFRSWIASPGIADLVRRHWRWPDMQAATLYWSGRWTSIDVSYSVLYAYPSVESARGLHFAGVKPWAWREDGFARRLQRFPDYRLWSTLYREMLARYPELRALRRVSLLDERTAAALGAG